MFRSIIFIVAGSVLASCTHTQVATRAMGDDRLTCKEIDIQASEVRAVLRDIDEKTGVSGRNVAMAVFFWPGVIVNQMNAGDARKAANERLGILADLAKSKNCSP